MRAPVWLIALLVLLIVGIGVYGYFTTPLPLGLNSVIRTPGGANLPQGANGPGASPARTAAGQPLQLGALTVSVETVQRNQNVFGGGESGNASAGGPFTVVQVGMANAGNQSITMQASDFRLVDDRGRTYAVDAEATRMACQAARRRSPFDATVPPGGRLETALAFETAPDANTLSLHVALGYGEVELPR
jgi:Domain of unknown function (DUF4352)